MKFNDIIKYRGNIGRVIGCYGDMPGQFRFYPKNKGNYSKDELEIIDLKYVEDASINDKISLIKSDCPWGEVIRVHCISNIQIVEYIDKVPNSETLGKSAYSIYIDYLSTSRGANSLDEAIISALTYKYKCDGATHWIFKMLGL